MKRSNVSRRAFLGGAAVVLGLPALESLMPRQAFAEPKELRRRIIAFYVPNGVHMPAWTLAGQGTEFALSPILAPIERMRKKILVLSGLDNLPARPEGPGDHAAGTAGFLTCRHVVKTEGAGIKNGISMDQVAAQHLGQFTRIPSLQLGTSGGSSAGDCDSGYSCAYARNISWASETQPLPKAVNPQVVWDILFGGFDPKASAEEQARRLAYGTSVIDYALDESSSLMTRLGTTDKRKLDEYLTGVRELEKKIQKSASGPMCTPMERPPSNLPYPEHVKLMLDLTAMAIQCDSTRVVSFMLGNALSGQTYPFLELGDGQPLSGGHHEISHHQGLKVNFDKLTVIDRWEVEQFVYLLEKLDAIDEGDGVTALDTSAVFFSSELEDGNAHSHTNLPVLIGGSLGGKLTTGRHVAYKDGSKTGNSTPIANLFISMLQGVGVDINTFGDDGTGPLPDLT
uniref:TAT pathway signal sequence domain-containing protein n=1 Tax=Byssovorax cruenta TaxID=293647 RepID=A0A3S7UZB9_9BACT|nr:TAT pathway signal sequence domain-containing protein [Byssovorax cruenta]